MNRFVAWGANVMIRVKNPNFSEGGIILSAEKEKPFEPQGVVVSCGSLVRNGNDLVNRTVRFNGGMVMDEHGSKEDPELFLLVNDAAINSVAVEEDEGIGIQLN